MYLPKPRKWKTVQFCHKHREACAQIDKTEKDCKGLSCKGCKESGEVFQHRFTQGLMPFTFCKIILPYNERYYGEDYYVYYDEYE